MVSKHPTLLSREIHQDTEWLLNSVHLLRTTAIVRPSRRHSAVRFGDGIINLEAKFRVVALGRQTCSESSTVLLILTNSVYGEGVLSSRLRQAAHGIFEAPAPHLFLPIRTDASAYTLPELIPASITRGKCTEQCTTNHPAPAIPFADLPESQMDPSRDLARV